jgi:hypothetical protein
VFGDERLDVVTDDALHTYKGARTARHLRRCLCNMSDRAASTR